jgi:hypothetical protein
MEKFIGEFDAKGDDGEGYRINIYHRQSPGEDYSGAQPDAASITLRTMIGQLLTRTAEGAYVIRETGVQLRSDAANAP